MKYMNLKEFYNEVAMLTPGSEIEHRGYTLKKVEVGGISPPDHTEVGIFNTKGVRVENFTVGAFDTFQEFSQRLDEVISYDPDDMKDWLNRDK